MVEKFRQKFRNIRDAFATLDIRGDGRITMVELQAGLARKFDISLSAQIAAAVVARYNASPPGEPAAFDFASFASMYDGAFTQYMTASIGGKAPAGSTEGLTNAFDFTTHTHSLVAVDPTAEQAALATLRRVGAKLRQHAQSSERSRHFTELFVKMDVDRTGMLSADEISLGMSQLGLELRPSEVLQLFDALDVGREGRISIAAFMLLVQRGSGIDAVPWANAEAGRDIEAAATMPPAAFVAEPSLVPADFKKRIAEGSPAHVAVAKIAATLDSRKIKLRAAFKKLDVSGDGSISAEDLPKGLAAIGIYISPARAAKMVAHFDRTGDGRLHYHEFVRLLSETRAESHEEKAAGAVARTAAPVSEPEPEPEPAEGSDAQGQTLTVAGTEEGGAVESETEDVSDILAAISYSVYRCVQRSTRACARTGSVY